MIRRSSLGMVGVLLLLLASGPLSATPSAYEEEIRAWREKRLTRLQSDTGWLTVAGLFWLVPGENTFGTAPDNAIVLPVGSAPEHAGVFVHADGATTVRAHPGTSLRCRDREVDALHLRTDLEDSTDVVELGRLRFFVIVRGGRHAIRLRDLESPMRRDFHGIESWPVDPAWRVEARFEPYDPPRWLAIPTILGTVDSMLCPGALHFELQGQSCRLEPVIESPDDSELFIIFADATNGEETYGAGRFVYADAPENGRTVVDFNKAYNPPCAFTPYATCPLPPRQNELALPVRAGEKTYGEH